MTPALEKLARALEELMPEKPAPAPDPEDDPSSAPPPPEPPYFEKVEFASRGIHLDATVPAGQVVAVASLIDQQEFAIDAVTGVDWIAEEQMEVVYDFYHPTEPWRVAVRTRVPRADPEVPTISEVFPGANWHERETHEFFGIRFAGHPNLTPFILPEDADYHPLRKDFSE
jgi:NADH-quinone oxidoreductase subunit C